MVKMRLSQLARKLEISPSELILFFKKNRISTYNSPNNKIEENDLKLALNHFGPVGVEADNSDTKKPVKEASEPETADDKVDVEVISMPKIKLEGVKVIGKIELPEHVKKVKDDGKSDDGDQNKESENISHDVQKRENQKTKKRTLRQKNKHKHKRRELSYEEKLKREERKKIQEQQRAKKLKKEQKKLHYVKNLQSNISPPRKKKKSRKTDEIEPGPIRVRPEYKNPIRKFWAWLNGEYDR